MVAYAVDRSNTSIQITRKEIIVLRQNTIFKITFSKNFEFNDSQSAKIGLFKIKDIKKNCRKAIEDFEKGGNYLGSFTVSIT